MRRGFKNSKKLESTPSWTHGTSLIKAHISDRALEALKAVVSPGDLVVQKKLRGTQGSHAITFLMAEVLNRVHFCLLGDIWQGRETFQLSQ